MFEKESFKDKVKAGVPILSGIALMIACILGVVMIVCLIKLANTMT
ncbi:MAG: hypothetical protein K2K64_07015 [Muribaculaceae bacterium]|nr:hypothetical protein [Muribaculaceae bacterium]MDE7108903.1 hypothetical protein [Muribaculaceae bacterium]